MAMAAFFGLIFWAILNLGKELEIAKSMLMYTGIIQNTVGGNDFVAEMSKDTRERFFIEYV